MQYIPNVKQYSIPLAQHGCLLDLDVGELRLDDLGPAGQSLHLRVNTLLPCLLLRVTCGELAGG